MNRQNKRLLLLYSLILVVIPMVIFPTRLGLPLMSGSAIYMIYEVAFYGLVLFLFRRDASLLTLTLGAALLLVYRMTLGAAFGVTIIAMYGLGVGVAFSLGMAKYLPAVLLHILATPLVMRPVFRNLADNLSPVRMPHRPSAQTFRVEPGQEETLPQLPRTVERAAPPMTGPRGPEPSRLQAPRVEGDSLFEKAVAYLGESAAVRMAILVDEEGLSLARFSRCDEDEELWAPLAIILEGHNRQVLNQYKRGGDPEKIDITTKQSRIVVRRIEHVILVVLADRDADETVLIRIAQAADMIRKYMSERYSPALFARVEERYVSNT